MTRLPRDLSGSRVIRALGRAGFYTKRRKGSHVVLRRDDPLAQVVLRDHKSIDTGTLASILDGAGLSVEESVNLL